MDFIQGPLADPDGVTAAVTFKVQAEDAGGGLASTSQRVRVARKTVEATIGATPSDPGHADQVNAPPAALVQNLWSCSEGPDCHYGPISGRYKMYGNDAAAGLGDCTFAAAAHWEQIALQVGPPDEALIGNEFARAGGSDTGGLPMETLFAYWSTHGIAKYRISGATEYPGLDKASVENAVRIFGALIARLDLQANGYLGTISIPEASSHAVVVDGFTLEGPLIVTWGRTMQMTWAQWDAYAKGMWVVTAA
ncbi:MAG: hypothetical protein U0Y82_05465 [Thermoleophilia bacterium]